MMKQTKIHINLLYILFVLLYASCDQAVNLELPAYESKIGVYGVLETYQNPRVFVNRSAGYFEPLKDRDGKNVLLNADVRILHNGNTYPMAFDTVSYYTEWYFNSDSLDWLIDTIPFGSYTNYDLIVENGSTYALVVESLGETVSSETSVSSGNANFNVNLELIEFEDEWSPDLICYQNLFEIEYEINNNHRFYEVELWREDWTSECFWGEDSCLVNGPWLSYSGRFELTPGVGSFDLPSWFYSCSSLVSVSDSSDWFIHEVKLISISEDTYTFKEAREQQQNSDGNPFVEPSPLWSNIDDGIGLFGSRAILSSERIKTYE